MPKKVLKAKQIENLENTSFASLLMPLSLDMPCGSATVCICIPSCQATCCPNPCTGGTCTAACSVHPTNDLCIAVSDVGVGVVIQV